MSSVTPSPLLQTSGKASDPEFRITLLCLAGVIAIFGYLVVYHVHHEREGFLHLGDFPTFYQAAVFAREHRDIYTAGNPTTDQLYVYPPLIAFVYAPLTLLSLKNAAMLMLFVTALCLAGSVFLGAREMLGRLEGLRPLTLCAAAFLISALSENEMRGVMTMLETDALMILLFTLALCWLDRRPILSGLALAFAFNIKYLSIVTLPYLILRRRWTAVAAMLGGSVLFALLPALELGWKEDIRCLRVSMGGLLRWVGVAPEVSHSIKIHNIADGLSVSITSALARILGARGFSNPQVLVAAAGVAILALLIVLLMYHRNGLALWVWPNRESQGRMPFRSLVGFEWAGLVVAAMAFSPDTNTRHLILTILVNAAAAAVLLVPRPSVPRLPALAGALLIFFGYIMPGAKALRHMGFNHFVYGVPCWGLLIGYLLILWTGLRFAAQAAREKRQET